ncbi:hypothetical protein [Floridanema evergladense]|uniref:Uncharacterized protein n=1 Tax=Floridaenema evergladense BLCC-F167 TaxID=3153639 RepID=A0ABV4WE75_9CYAN
MAKFDWQRYVFEDCFGQLREIRGCPLTKLDQLKDYLALLQDAILNYPEPEAHFKEIYNFSGYIKNITNSILNLCGVSPDWVTPDQMVGLVHHRIDSNGDFLPGLLVEMNFPSRSSGGGKAVEFKEWVANNIVLLVGLGLCKDLGEALDLADRVPSDQLEALILARLHQLDPKAKQKEELEELNSQPNNPDDETVLNFSSVQWQDIDLEKYLG